MTNNGRRDTRNDSVLAWIEGVLSALGSVRSAGPNGKWQCPAHARTGQHAVSLAVGVRDEGGVWLHCHAGCTVREVAAAMGLTLDQLRTPPRLSPARWITCRRLTRGFPAPKAGGSPRSQGYRHEAFHGYGPNFRKERLRHPVTGDKAIEWEARNPAGQWVPGLLGTREVDLPLYRQHEVIAAAALGETVLLVESESSVDALNHAGWYATTWAGGAGSAPLDRLAALLGDHDDVVVIGDADEAGRRCATRLAEVLPRARVLVSGREGEDARDLHHRLGTDRFAELVAATVAEDTPALAC
jgi:hypothetical protein